MSTTGIVRRIDDLGRVVIPKEIRKTLKIKDGEQLEIIVADNNIILKKFSNFSDIVSILNNFIDIINKIIEKNIIIFDNNKIIATSSNLKDIYVDKDISDELYEMIQNRKLNFISNGNIRLFEDTFFDGNYIFSSIITNGDAMGGILIISEDDFQKEDKMFLNFILEILKKYIEE